MNIRKKDILNTISVFFLLFTGISAHAETENENSGSFSEEKPVISDSLLGPAFSHHFSQEGAQLKGYKTVFNQSDYENYVSKACRKPVFNSQTIVTGSYGDCLAEGKSRFEEKKPIFSWQQKNINLGWQRSFRYSDHVDRLFMGAAIDSFDKPSVYFGGARQKNLYEGDRLVIDGGVSALVWWRTVSNDDGSLKKRLVPAVLPVVTLTDKKTNLGVNVSFIPAIKWQGRQYSVNTLIVQLSIGIP